MRKETQLREVIITQNNNPTGAKMSNYTKEEIVADISPINVLTAEVTISEETIVATISLI